MQRDRVLSSRTVFPANPASAILRRETVRLSPNNGQTFTYASNSTVQINIPQNAWLDPVGTYLSFKVQVVDSTGTAINQVGSTFLSEGAACVFESLHLYGNSQLLEQIQSFNLWTLALHKCTQPDDHLSTMGSCMGFGSEMDRSLWAATGKQYVCPLTASGLLGGSTGKLLPTGRIANGMRLDLQLAQPATAMRSATATHYYVISNVYLVAEMVFMDPSVEDMFTKALAQQPLAIKYNTVTNFARTLTGTIETVDLGLRSGSVNSVHAIMRIPTEIGIGYESLDKWTSGNTTSYYLTVAGQSVPSQPVDTAQDNWAQGYSEMVKSWNQFGSADYGSSITALNYRGKTGAGAFNTKAFDGAPVMLFSLNGSTTAVGISAADVKTLGIKSGDYLHLGANFPNNANVIRQINFLQNLENVTGALAADVAAITDAAATGSIQGYWAPGDRGFNIGVNLQKDSGHSALVDGVAVSGASPMSLQLTRSAAVDSRIDVFVDTTRELLIFADNSIQVMI